MTLQNQMHDHYLSMSHSDPILINTMGEHMLSMLPDKPTEIVVVCIGTDRSTGDSLGPIAGTLLTEMNLKNLKVYGTLHKPIHAKNLKEMVLKIKIEHQFPFIIAIDACLGKSVNVGHLITNTGPLKPGSALKKDLPAVGDIHLTGVVNIGGFMEYAVLQSTRLSTVLDIARKIASLLQRIDKKMKTHQQTSSINISIKTNNR